VSEYIVNPRRSPRAPSRCAALVHTPSAAWNGETEDISALGCQLVAPGAMARGLPLTLVFASPRVKGSLRVEGKVAWGSSQPPWRVGVAFVESSREQSEQWFSQLVAAHPGLAGLRRVPDRLPVDAMIFLAPPPSFLVDFTPEEVEVLRHVASGTTLASLRTRLAGTWNVSQRAVFSLLARGAVTVSRSASAHPSAWKKVMAELEADFVPEVTRSNRTVPLVERPPQRSTPHFDEELNLDLDPRFTPPPVPSPMMQTVDPAPPPPPSATPPAPHPGGATAGTGWRGGARTRSPDAQECFDLGRLELQAGRGHSALVHLRRALQLSPGDPEIAAEIGRAMSRP
jgi:hypothetical protein